MLSQLNPVSTLQLQSQPSLLLVLPSSHFSEPTIFLSPQTGEHLEGVPLQSQPVSFWQKQSQPSPLTLLPSSHVSLPAMTPSLHLVMQTDGDPVQDHPVSMQHLASQPSFGSVLPSSHFSVPATTLSPQVGWQLPVSQPKPSSTVHVEEHLQQSKFNTYYLTHRRYQYSCRHTPRLQLGFRRRT